MKVATGRVVGGKIVIEGEPLAEGSVERALLEAIAQADRGHVVSWEELREQLRRSV